MIVINGFIGLCIFVGGLTHHEMTFRNEGTNSALAVLTALATFTYLPAKFDQHQFVYLPAEDSIAHQLAHP